MARIAGRILVVISAVLCGGSVILWARSCGHSEWLTVNTTWGPDQKQWVQRDLVLRLRPGSLTVGQRVRKWDGAFADIAAPAGFEHRDITIADPGLWGLVGQFHVSRRFGTRPGALPAHPRFMFRADSLEFPLWVPTGIFAVAPMWYAVAALRRARAGRTARQAIGPGESAVIEPKARPSPALLCIAAGLVLVGLAASASGMWSLAMAVYLSGAAVVLVLLSGAPGLWPPRQR